MANKLGMNTTLEQVQELCDILIIKAIKSMKIEYIEQELLEEMSITGWLQSIFIDNKKEYWIN